MTNLSSYLLLPLLQNLRLRLGSSVSLYNLSVPKDTSDTSAGSEVSRCRSGSCDLCHRCLVVELFFFPDTF